MATAATTARAMVGDYLSIFFDIPTALGVLGVVIVLGSFAVRGLATSARINLVLTMIESAGLVLVIVAAITAVVGDEAEPSRITDLDTISGSPLTAVYRPRKYVRKTPFTVQASSTSQSRS